MPALLTLSSASLRGAIDVENAKQNALRYPFLLFERILSGWASIAQNVRHEPAKSKLTALSRLTPGDTRLRKAHRSSSHLSKIDNTASRVETCGDITHAKRRR